MTDKDRTDQQWRETLSEEQYDVLRCGGTERPFTGKYWNNKATGKYLCAGCGARLFESTTKYESGSGWPSFYAPADDRAIDERSDNKLAAPRTEIVCSKCGGHLGHVFNDGPKPTGLRYCVNSASLDFEAGKDEEGGGN